MTTERKIEVLEQAKRHEGLNNFCNGICSAILDAMGLSRLYQEKVFEYFPSIQKYKPTDLDDFQLWFYLDKENLIIRLSIIDEIILELKTQLP